MVASDLVVDGFRIDTFAFDLAKMREAGKILSEIKRDMN